MNTRVEQYLADEATMNWPGMVVGCRGPRWQGRTSSSDYVTPVTAAPCGCTLDCLQPITHRSSRDSCHFPFLRAYARGLQGYRSSPSAARSPRARPRPATSSGSRWRNNRLQRRTTTPGVSFPTQAATGQPQPSLSLENPRPVTRAARADVAKGERVQLFLPSFPLSYARARVSRTWSGELVTNGEYRPWSKASSFSRIDKIIRMAYGKEDWNEMATRRIDEILHIVAIDLSFD